MDKHLKTRVTMMVKMKMDKLMDQQETTLQIQQKVDQIMDKRLRCTMPLVQPCEIKKLVMK
jgi:hypothetical protein